MTTEASSKPLYRAATRASLLGLVVNLSLGVFKLVGGILGSSFALLSDAVNSLGDSLSSLVVLYALRIAQRPADREHPYGHTRAEAIAGSNVALLIIISALFIAWEALGRFSTEHAPPPMWTLWIAGANVVIKETLYRYKVRVGRRIQSSAIIANAWDHRSDALCSLAVLIGLTIVRFGGPSRIWVDDATALVVVGFIVFSAARLFRHSASELMDLQADDVFVRQIRQRAANVDGVQDVEKLFVRKSGLEFLVDIHIEVDAQMTVADGHEIGHHVKD
ncbi:MAG: cation diffusion facilitator family transporter, partial [Planctomycetes bacterium]|nr:cation diffusion facilitator family transporter [Planctomycetota bacterium]